MTDKITIKGAPPKFDPAVLKQRQEGYHHMYRNTDQRCTTVQANLAYTFLTKVVEMSNGGYSLTPNYPISTSPGDYSVYMVKPDAIQAADLIVIDEQVKQKYVKELEAERQEYRDLLTAQLVQAAELKEAKKVEDAHKKRMAEIEKEVNDVFGELIVPE